MNGDNDETPTPEPEGSDGSSDPDGTPARPPTIFAAAAVAGFVGAVVAGATGS